MAIYKKLYKFSELIDNYSSNNLLLLLLLIGFITFNIFIFPYFGKLYGLQDQVILDLLFGFTPEYAYTVLSGYGDYGREGIIVLSGLVDFLYPFIYGSFLALALSRFKIKPNYQIKAFQMANLMPFVGVIFDFIENTGILIMVNYYPEQIIPIALITSFAGIIKWIIIGGCILLLLFFLTKTIYIKKTKRVFNKQKNSYD